MTPEIVRSLGEIQGVVDWIDELDGTGRSSHYRGQTYEQGLRAMLDWLTDTDTDDPRG